MRPVCHRSGPGLISRLRRNRALRGGALVLGSTLAWQFSNFAFNSVGAHILGPASYGTLAAVVALLYIASPILVSVQMVASRTTTTLATRGDWAGVAATTRQYSRRAALAGVIVAGSCLVASRGIASFLKLPSSTPVAIIGMALGVSVVTHLQRGVLQGAMRFGRYAASALTEAITKVGGTAVILVVLARTVDGATAAVVGSVVAGLVANVVLLRFLPSSGTAPAEPIASNVRYSLVTAGSLLLLAALLSIDVLAARRYLPPETAGLYAAISVSGKIVFFATSALTVYLFPIFSRQHDIGGSGRRPILLALGFVGACGAALVLIYFLAPSIVVTPLFGHRYHAAGHYIGWMGIAAGAYAAVYLLATYLLAQKRAIGICVLGAAVTTQLAALYAMHSSISQFIAIDLVVFVGSGLLLAVLALQTRSVAAPVLKAA